MTARGGTVLLVDDEPLAIAGLESILGEDAGLDIVGRCGSGAEAIRAIDTVEPDLVFLDIALPDLDGFQVLERLETRARPEIVFVTAHSDRALRAFEMLSVGVEGKCCLWEGLRTLSATVPPLRGTDYDDLLARARAQRAWLEEQRLAATGRVGAATDA